MRILIVGLNFPPEIIGIGKYTGEMAAYLSSKRNHVRVITTPPYYPYWRVQAGYRGREYRRESWSGVEVYRCPLWVPRNPSGIKRILHLLSFAVSSLPVLLAQIFWHPQIVLCVAPSLFSAPFALAVARLAGAKAWLHVQDFELDTATNLGMIGSDNLFARCAVRGESWLLRMFDRVSTISDRMLAHLAQKGVHPDRAYFFPNWVNTDTAFPLPDPAETLREGFGIPKDKVVVLYSGNMGNKQGLEILVEAARELREDSCIHFVLCGEGSARVDLERSAGELQNLQFLSLQPPEKLNHLLNAADIHILPQRADAADLVMPSKLLGMLASAKPVIATAHPGTEIGTVVSQVGVLVPPGNQSALCEAILRLAGSLPMRIHLGQKGRAFACEKWSTEHILTDFGLHLQELQSAA